MSQKHVRVKPVSRRCHSITRYVFGTLYTRSAEISLLSKVSDDEARAGLYEYKRSYIVHPATWLVNFGFTYGLRVELAQSSILGWKGNLNTFRPVPDDALIFEFCVAGNSLAVRNLLSKGQASDRDTDSFGRNALHVSYTFYDIAMSRNGVLNERTTNAFSSLLRKITILSCVSS